MTRNFIGYEYKEVTVPSGQASFYLDCYEILDGSRMKILPHPPVPI